MIVQSVCCSCKASTIRAPTKPVPPVTSIEIAIKESFSTYCLPYEGLHRLHKVSVPVEYSSSQDI